MSRRRLKRDFSIDLGGEQTPTSQVLSSNSDSTGSDVNQEQSGTKCDDKGKPQTRGFMQVLRGRIRKMKLAENNSVAKLSVSDDQVKIEIGIEQGWCEDSFDDKDEEVLSEITQKNSFTTEYDEEGVETTYNPNKPWADEFLTKQDESQNRRKSLGFRKRIMQCRLFRSFSMDNGTNFSSIEQAPPQNKEKEKDCVQKSRPRLQRAQTIEGVVIPQTPGRTQCYDIKSSTKSINEKQQQTRGIKIEDLNQPTANNTCEGDTNQRTTKARTIVVAPISTDSENNLPIVPSSYPPFTSYPNIDSISIPGKESPVDSTSPTSGQVRRILPPLRSNRSIDTTDSPYTVSLASDYKEVRKRDSLIEEFSLFKPSPTTKPFPTVMRPRSKTMPARPEYLASRKINTKPMLPLSRSTPQTSSLDSPKMLSPQTSPGITPRSPREPMKARPLSLDVEKDSTMAKFNRQCLSFPYGNSSSLESNDSSKSPCATKSCLKSSNERFSFNEQKGTKKVSWSPDIDRKRPTLFRTYSLDNSDHPARSHLNCLRKSTSALADSVDYSPKNLLKERHKNSVHQDRNLVH